MKSTRKCASQSIKISRYQKFKGIKIENAEKSN